MAMELLNAFVPLLVQSQALTLLGLKKLCVQISRVLSSYRSYEGALRAPESAKQLKENIVRFILEERQDIRFAEHELQSIASALASGEKKFDIQNLYALNDRIRAKKEQGQIAKRDIAGPQIYRFHIDLPPAPPHCATSAELSLSMGWKAPVIN
jgi:hypothetical protein